MKLGGKLEKYGWIGLLVLGFSLQLYFVYFGLLFYHYIVPPGYDSIPHYAIIQAILNHGSIFSTGYPPLFHLIVAGLSKITTVEPFTILTAWTPILILLPSAAMFFLLRQLFSTRVSVITTLILLLTSGYPLYAFVDGNYPDILAYGVFAVFMFGFILRFFRTNQARNLIFAGIFFILIALTHHFTFANILGIMLVFIILQLILAIIQKKVKWNLKVIFSGAAVLVIFVLGIYVAQKLYGGTISSFLDGLLHNKSVINDSYLNQPMNFEEYAKAAGNVVWYVGLISLFYVMITIFTKPEEGRTKQLVIIWFLVFYILSRLDSSGLPARFMRELALPLTVCVGFLINYLLELNPAKNRYGLMLGYGLIGYFIIMNSALYAGLNKLPNAFNEMIWFWPKDQKKLDYLAANVPSSATIIYNPNANVFVPIKSANKLQALELTPKQFKVADTLIINGDKSASKDYLVVRQQLLKTYKGYYIFDDVKPPSNPSSITYPVYTNYELYRGVLDDLVRSGQVLARFPDGSVLYQLK